MKMGLLFTKDISELSNVDEIWSRSLQSNQLHNAYYKDVTDIEYCDLKGHIFLKSTSIM